MKLKTMTLLAVSGLMAASLAYVVPAFAEDNFDMAANEVDGAPVQLAMADDAGNDNAGATDNNGGNGASDSSGSAASGNNTGAANTGAASSTDQGTPDVASGDDDY